MVVSWPVLHNGWDTLTRGWHGPEAGLGSVSQDTEYFCPMCPGVVADWPGKCPVCNMALVRRKKGEAVPLPDGVLARIPGAILTGHRRERLPNNASFVFPGADGASLVTALDLEGFAVSSGSACTSGDTEPSHVILALGIDRESAKGSLRITVGRSTAAADIEAFLATLPGVVSRIRGEAAVPA